MNKINEDKEKLVIKSITFKNGNSISSQMGYGEFEEYDYIYVDKYNEKYLGWYRQGNTWYNPEEVLAISFRTLKENEFEGFQAIYLEI